jgi:hypothetical protein
VFMCHYSFIILLQCRFLLLADFLQRSYACTFLLLCHLKALSSYLRACSLFVQIFFFWHFTFFSYGFINSSSTSTYFRVRRFALVTPGLSEMAAYLGRARSVAILRNTFKILTGFWVTRDIHFVRISLLPSSQSHRALSKRGTQYIHQKEFTQLHNIHTYTSV